MATDQRLTPAGKLKLEEDLAFLRNVRLPELTERSGTGGDDSPDPRVWFDPTLVRDAHASGHQVVVWSIDSAAAVPLLAAARVDGIITDRPDVVRAALRAP